MGVKRRVGVVGYLGYGGAEAVRILRKHPNVEPVLVDHRELTEAEKPALGDGLEHLRWDGAALADAGLDLVMLATPHEASMDMAPVALEAGLKVIDLSGAFRLRTTGNYTKWYGFEHTRPDLLQEAAYGLPEYFRQMVKIARLVANPGCYPTAANLALRPLITDAVLDRDFGAVIDAKSGVSGAGKKPSPNTHFSSVTENLSAYGVLTHRHVPEVMLISDFEEHEFSFTAQLLPVHRGILETIYVRTADGVGREEIMAAYERYYANEPFVRLYPEGRVPTLQDVEHTNFCDIGVVFHEKGNRMVIVAAIDNLVKGAAGQAVQNMNLLLGFDETAALL